MTDTSYSLTQEQRVTRVLRLIEESNALVDEGIEKLGDGKRIVAVCGLYSGGNDSTTLMHVMRERVTHAVHVNTGIGVEQTREFVRDTCAKWGIPLIEKHPPPGSTYRELVLDQGFPGPAMHWKMYQRLKERGLRLARKELVKHPRQERVVFLAGRRRDESNRRANVPEMEREGSVIWISPLVNWTKLDLNTYRQLFDVPRNEVSDMLHMSGECLCGAFAKPNELEEIGFFFPEVKEQIEALEAEVRACGKHEEKRCKWGWGGEDKYAYRQGVKQSGPLCSACDVAYQLSFEGMADV